METAALFIHKDFFISYKELGKSSTLLGEMQEYQLRESLLKHYVDIFEKTNWEIIKIRALCSNKIEIKF